MNKSSTKPIIALAILSFILALSQHSGANPSVNTPQSSINTVAVEQSPNTQSQFDAPESNQAAGAAAILTAGIVVVGILSLMNKTRYSPKSQENTIQFNHASRELQNKLLRLLHGDRGAAFRLLSQVKMRNPGRATNWYFEKVIYDLQRDHGRL